MVHASAARALGRRLRVGMVGGGRERLHRRRASHGDAARRLDRAHRGRAFRRSRKRARCPAPTSASRPIASMPTIARWRAREAARPDGIEAVVIVTPNHLHYPVAKAFLEAGIDVICDKPLSTTLARRGTRRAGAGAAGVRGDAQQHRLSHGAAGARDDRGRRARRHPRRPRRLYPGLADAADRRRRPEAGGMAHRPRARRRLGCLADIGVHAHNLALFVTGLELDAVSADLTTFVPAAGSTTTPMCCCVSPAARAAC